MTIDTAVLDRAAPVAEVEDGDGDTQFARVLARIIEDRDADPQSAVAPFNSAF